MADDTNAREALHSAIMNLPCLERDFKREDVAAAYRLGHKAARHAAAEIVLATPADRGAPAEGAVPDEARERGLFEAYIAKDCGDLSTFGHGANMHYCNSAVNNAWEGWLNRARLAAPTSQAGRDALDAAVVKRAAEQWYLQRSPQEVPHDFELAARLAFNAFKAGAALASSAQAGQGEQA